MGRGGEEGSLTPAFVPRRQEQPVEKAEGDSVHFGTNVGVGAWRISRFLARRAGEVVGVGSATSRFWNAGNVASRAGTVVTAVTVVVLFHYALVNVCSLNSKHTIYNRTCNMDLPMQFC
jgi:hypothetical protein